MPSPTPQNTDAFHIHPGHWQNSEPAPLLHGRDLGSRARITREVLPYSTDAAYIAVQTTGPVHEIKAAGEFLDFEAQTWPACTFDFSGHKRGLVSSINGRNKYTEGLYDCMGLVCIGTSTNTGEEHSFISHHPPATLFSPPFGDGGSLRRILELMRRTSQDGSLDAYIFGGHDAFSHLFGPTMQKLSQLVNEHLGFEPMCSCGPNYRGNTATDIYVATQARRLYVVRCEQGLAARDEQFLPSQVNRQKIKWEVA